MRIAVHSASEAVHRVLEEMLIASGHQPVAAANAELHLYDTTHPLAEQATAHTPKILLGGNRPEALNLPLRMATLVQAIARAATPTVALAGGWALDRAARALVHAQHPAQPLTEKESALLGALSGGIAISRERLLSEVWGMAGQVETHTLETHIYRLRAKLNGLSPLPCDVITEGGNYRLALL